MSSTDTVALSTAPPTRDLNESGLRNLRSKMADEINCYTAEDISELAKVKLETLAYWRKHGKGPKPIRFGDAYLYPKNSVMAFISSLMDTGHGQDEFIKKCI